MSLSKGPALSLKPSITLFESDFSLDRGALKKDHGAVIRGLVFSTLLGLLFWSESGVSHAEETQQPEMGTRFSNALLVPEGLENLDAAGSGKEHESTPPAKSSTAKSPKLKAKQLRKLLAARPVPGRVSSLFGNRHDPLKKRGKRLHKGLDFAAKRGVAVHSAGTGIVAKSGRMGSYGNVVFVDHGNGVQTRYAHLSKLSVSIGQQVKAGHVVGAVGTTGRSTGPHLHFELRVKGRPTNPKGRVGFRVGKAPKKRQRTRRPNS